jgi:hypothetical protein
MQSQLDYRSLEEWLARYGLAPCGIGYWSANTARSVKKDTEMSATIEPTAGYAVSADGLVHGVCSCCKCKLPNEDGMHSAATYSGGTEELYCEKCYYERFTPCNNCNRMLYTAFPSLTFHRVEEEVYCHMCYMDHFFVCYRCDGVFEREQERVTCGGDSYCEQCYSDNFVECVECHNEAFLQDACWIEDEPYCCNCASEMECWYPEQIAETHKCDELRSSRNFGIELETSSCPRHVTLRGQTCFGCKRDSTIDGKEFYSPILSGDRGLKEVRDFCKKADDLGFKVDKKCGFHLHINTTGMPIRNLRKLAFAYLTTESVWTQFAPANRRLNNYCAPLTYSKDQCKKILSPSTWNEFVFHKTESRYKWVNWIAYCDHGTVEIRLHTSTLNSVKICNWIKAHLRFVEWVIAHSETEIEEMFKGTRAQKFLALCEIWDDPALSVFYRQRIRKFANSRTEEDYDNAAA